MEVEVLGRSEFILELWRDVIAAAAVDLMMPRSWWNALFFKAVKDRELLSEICFGNYISFRSEPPNTRVRLTSYADADGQQCLMKSSRPTTAILLINRAQRRAPLKVRFNNRLGIDISLFSVRHSGLCCLPKEASYPNHGYLGVGF